VKQNIHSLNEQKSDVTFMGKELQVLDKLLECNLHHKPKTWIKALAVEADTGIRALPKKDQAYMRQLVASNIKKLIMKQNTNNKRKRTKHGKENILRILHIEKKVKCLRKPVSKIYN
jgi:ABC-type lipopolysaccharide export system ATPase subunit